MPRFSTCVRLLVVLSLAVINSAAYSYAQTDIYIRGSGKMFPIALPRLCLSSSNSEAAKQVPEVISRDLTVSGYFEVLNPNVYIETPGKCGAPDALAYSDWSVIGAEGLVRGVVEPKGSGVKVQLYLHDVQRQKIILGKEYEGDSGQVPRIAHRFANEIMKYFTGEYGVFGTQISFTSREGRFKELFVMDMDGSNVRRVTSERSLALSSSWDPAGKSLVYTSYRNRVPDMFVVEVESKRVEQLTRGDAMEIGGKFSKDGSLILGSLSSGKDTDIALFTREGRIAQRLTSNNGAIDVSPDWSPDNSQIVFVSNRAGGPQIYTMNRDGSAVKRISFASSNYCTSPSWSPKGDRIAFICRADRGHNIFTVDPDGSDPLQLTSYGNNEDPDWSPDGRYVVFATTFGKGPVYHLALLRSDGSSMHQLTDGRTSDSQPSWGPLAW